jgi:hypothetical protein
MKGALPGLLLATLPALAGCSPLIYVLAGGASGDDSGLGTISVGQTVSSSTADSSDDWAPSCAGDGNDNAWLFVPPSTGMYRMHVDSQYDAVVMVVDEDSRDELACNDDSGSTAASEVQLNLDGGRRYLVVVDGYRGASGQYSLTVDQNFSGVPTPVPTPTPTPNPVPPNPGGVVEDVGVMTSRCQQAPVLQPGMTQGVVDPNVGSAALSCGAGGRGGDVVYQLRITAPSVVSIQEESQWDAVLELRAGCSSAAGAEVLSCVDDAPDTMHSAIQTRLPPGTYFLVVDSYQPGAGGPFTLNVQIAPDNGPGQTL